MSTDILCGIILFLSGFRGFVGQETNEWLFSPATRKSVTKPI